MDAGSRLTRLDTLDGYRQSFTDAVLWRPFVERVCRGHGWTCNRMRPGIAGTFPTFIVDDQRVVKFFGRLFKGEECWRVEQEAAHRMVDVPEVPVAKLMASGTLDGELGWAYLVFEYVPGVSIGEVYANISFKEKWSLARRLGEWLPLMHRIEVRPGPALARLSEDLARSWFASRWPKERTNWPIHLAGQVEAYLSENAAFLRADSDCFIHADLTQDHILGRYMDGHFIMLAIIDFGDAMQGNIYYELAALHLDLFACDKRLLTVFLQAYGLPPGRDFVRMAMVTSLLHQFDVYAPLFAWKPELMAASSLDELAEWIWNVNHCD
jgi:hygromycin-B 7''-O-kinase